MKIAQALHGYADGHRLLAQSGGISKDVLRQLDRMSDLSGYLPEGVEFSVYHTGFPTADGYAFSATWPDATAPRGGAVLTHTLLLPKDLIATSANPWRWTTLHTKPASAADISPYKATLTAQLDDGPLSRMPPDALLTLYFGQPKRPVLWTGQEAELAATLWAFLWPSARMRFRFCTMALQPIQDGRTPFDLLVLPVQATSAFHGLVGTHPWVRPNGPPIPTSSWIDDLQADGGAALRSRITSWEAETGRAVPPEQVPQFVRLDALRPSIQLRLAAARTFADLLTQLDPSGAHPLWTEAISALLDRQPEAAMEPRPLWDLSDLLKRPQLHRVLERSDLGTTLRQILAGELERRAETVPQMVAQTLPKLFAAWQRFDADHALQTISKMLARRPSWAERVIVAAAKDSALDLMRIGLPFVSQESRIRALQDARLSSTQIDALAEQLEDPSLLIATWHEPPTIDDLERIALAWRKTDPRGPLRDLLLQVPPTTLLTWALQTTMSDPAAWRIAARAARDAAVDLSELAMQCEQAINGPAVFEAASRHRSSYVLSQSLKTVEQLPRALLPIAKGALREALGETIPPSEFLRGSAETSLANLGFNTSNRLAHALVEGITQGEISSDRALDWLTQPSVDQVIAGISERQLKPSLGGRLTVWSSIFAKQPKLMRGRAALRILQLLLDDLSTEELDASTEHLLALLRNGRGSWVRDLSVFVAHAVRRFEPTRAQPLLALSFGPVHEAMRTSYRPTLWFLWPFGQKKDEEEWECWLVHLARRQGWSKDDLRACGGQSSRLQNTLLQRYQQLG